MSKEYLIGDFLNRIKRQITLEPNKIYNLVTIKMNHKGVILRGQKKGSDIKSKMYVVKEGDFILSGIDARNGAFGIVGKELEGAIVTNDFWYFEINETIISKRLFLELTATTWFDNICQKASDGTTQRIRLQKEKFFNQKIKLPELIKQKKILDKILAYKLQQQKLHTEIQTQKKLVLKLKQAFLREAFQGKLTQEWREKNPITKSANQLLEHIKSEKKQLLTTISKDEIPYEIPDKWSWCRIGEVSENKTGNSINKTLKENRYKKINEGFSYIGTKDIPFKMSTINYDTGVKIPIGEKSFKVAKIGSTFICIEGGSSGKKIGFVEKEVCYGNKLLACTPFVKGLSKYIYYLFYSCHFKNEFKNQSKGLRGGVSVNSFKEIKIPIPPLNEVDEIVERIETLMNRCNKLETEIALSEENANMLMQAVLKEAFQN